LTTRSRIDRAQSRVLAGILIAAVTREQSRRDDEFADAILSDCLRRSRREDIMK
jgi:hypothetical protein